MTTPQPKTSRNLYLGIVIILGFLTILTIMTYYKWQQYDPRLSAKIDTQVLKLLPFPIAVPQVTLTQKDGTPWQTTQLHNQWTFLYFGYTLCPDVCPTELGALADVAQAIRAQTHHPHVGFLFVSVDPNRDTIERLQQFTNYFDPQINAATGDETELRIMAQPLGAAWDKVAQFDEHGKPDPNNYLINHTTSILLIDPQGRAVGIFPTPHQPEAMVKAFNQVVPE